MPNKDWLHIKLYITLVLSILYVIGELVLSHFTHILTLQFAAYHMLCNIVALTGRLFTVKKNEELLTRQIDDNIITGQIKGNESKENYSTKAIKNEENCGFMKFTRTIPVPLTQRNHVEQKLRNTFGWVRIDCLFMSVCFIFLSSFSIVHATEVLKNFLHMNHHKHTAHYPELILIYGFIGLSLNILTSLLIGGYTVNQDSFMHINPITDVNLNQVEDGNNKISTPNMIISKINIDNTKSGLNGTNYNDICQQLSYIIRDISSIIFVLICASIIYFYSNTEIIRYVDPVISLISCFILLALTFPCMHESCLVLLQTIPGSIDIENFQKKLLSKFHEIVKLHDFHIWSLTANKYVSTVHIIFENPEAYLKIMSDLEQFFRDQGITIVTIQPEFEKQSLTYMPEACLISCNSLECMEKSCCKSQTDLKELTLLNDLNGKAIHIDEQSKIKKHFRIISVNSLQEINSNTKSIQYLTNGNISNSRIDENNIKKFSSDSQISSTASTTSTNVSITFEPDNQNICETNITANTMTTNNSSATSFNENFNERL